MIRKTQIDWVASAILLSIVALVYQQIHTVMIPAGIAKGGPIENAAAYPRAIATIIGLLVIIEVVKRIVTQVFQESKDEWITISTLQRSVLLVLTFALYLGSLNLLGYHLSTAPFLFAIMAIAGEKQWLRSLVTGIVVSISLAFLFEILLKLVLPGGVFRLNIPW